MCATSLPSIPFQPFAINMNSHLQIQKTLHDSRLNTHAKLCATQTGFSLFKFQDKHRDLSYDCLCLEELLSPNNPSCHACCTTHWGALLGWHYNRQKTKNGKLCLTATPPIVELGHCPATFCKGMDPKDHRRPAMANTRHQSRVSLYRSYVQLCSTKDAPLGRSHTNLIKLAEFVPHRIRTSLLEGGSGGARGGAAMFRVATQPKPSPPSPSHKHT